MVRVLVLLSALLIPQQQEEVDNGYGKVPILPQEVLDLIDQGYFKPYSEYKKSTEPVKQEEPPKPITPPTPPPAPWPDPEPLPALPVPRPPQPYIPRTQPVQSKSKSTPKRIQGPFQKLRLPIPLPKLFRGKR